MNIKIPQISHPFMGIGKKIESMARKAIFDFSMLKGIKKLAIALSGGKDSLCLLFMLKAILKHSVDDIELVAIHIDGDFSCGASFEKKFLQLLADEIGVKIYFKEQKIYLKKNNCYSCSRVRRKLIFDTAKENDIETIAFGHTRDDNIQTVILNLFHKGDFEGMLPKIKLHKFEVTLIRPLIYVSEKEILQFANNYKILKTFCKCPIGQTSKRKEVKKIIKEIQDSFPNIEENLSKAAFLYGSQKALNSD